MNAFISPNGLTCSTKKSTLLIIRPAHRTRRSMPTDDPQIELHPAGRTIPTVNSNRIPGLNMNATGSNTQIIKALYKQTTQTILLISRITNRKGGMKEESTIKLTHAFIISRTIYVAPYVILKKGKKNQQYD